jgi:hypothetical protein
MSHPPEHYAQWQILRFASDSRSQSSDEVLTAGWVRMKRQYGRGGSWSSSAGL